MWCNVVMTLDIAADTRLDPRLRRFLEFVPSEPMSDVGSREELLAEANTTEALAAREGFRSIMDLCDDEQVAPSTGLTVTTREFTSDPDGNAVKLQVIRPESDEPLPCVYYIHGGGMATMSCYDGMYRSWGRIIAANGVQVVMVDFRNSVVPSSAPDVAPFPPGSTTACPGCAGWSPRRVNLASTRRASSLRANPEVETSRWPPASSLSATATWV
jgi:hypothetical protein